MSHASKQKLREELENLINGIPEGIRRIKTSAIHDALERHPAYRSSLRPALTFSIGNEVSTVPILEKRKRQNLPVILPRVTGRGTMTFHQVESPLADLATSRWGIPEPDPTRDPEIQPENLDLIVVPGLGFDPTGNRLGRGGGFFDQFLRRVPRKVPRIGICFDCQIVPLAPTDEHDEPVDEVITERTHYRFQEIVWETHSPEETRNLAAVLAKELVPPCLVRLEGSLGAGKTEWVRGFLSALGWSGRVRSPTFSLENDYPLENGGEVAHLDGYRLESPNRLDIEWIREILDRQPAYILVEWPERFGNILPPFSACITIEITGERRRKFRWRAFEVPHHLPARLESSQI